MCLRRHDLSKKQKTHMKNFIVMCLIIFAASNTYAANKEIIYAGKAYKINVFNQDVAEKEIGAAKCVYAFELAEFNLNSGNTAESLECLYNTNTEEYAITTYIKDQKGIIEWKAIIFSSKGAKMIKFDPKTKEQLAGFEYADPTEVGFVGYSSKAGYANANHNDKHNSLIVFIK